MKSLIAALSVRGVLLALGGLLWADSAQAQPCPLAITAPSNTASINIAGFPWAHNNDAAAINPDYTSNYMVMDTAGLPTGYYPGWCIDYPDSINGSPELYSAVLYSSCDTNIDTELPNNYPSSVYVNQTAWHQINYLLNHKNGAYFYNVQLAIWSLIGGPIDSSALDGNPPFNLTVVSNLLLDVTNNAANWTFQCGDVIAVVVAVHPNNGDPVNSANPNDQLTIIEVPYPCNPCITVSKQIACLQPTNDCSVFEKTATGFIGTNSPGFCYQITVNNCGNITLTNLVVSDNLLGDITGQFFASPATPLLPGASVTRWFKMTHTANATNTVTVEGFTSLSQSVTNGTTVYTNDAPVVATDQAVALVETAAIGCNISLYSPLDLNNPAIPGSVLLPSATIYSTPPTVTFSIQVCNMGSANLMGVTISSDAMNTLGCTMPPPFPLAVGQCTNIQLCVESVPCPGLTFTISVGGNVSTTSGYCGIYDLTSTNLIGVGTACIGTVSCSNTGCQGVSSVAGNVYLNCSPSSPVAPTEPALAGLAVTLLGPDDSTVLASTTTDINGYYTFGSMAAGTYYVSVTPPANYSETYPVGVTSSQIQFTTVACENLVTNFGYADNTPVTLNVPGGTDYGCNPTTPPTDASVKATVTAAHDDRGPATVVVTDVATTNGCLVSDVFTVVATGTCGATATTNVTYTWTANSTVPTITVGNAYVGGDLGCNPAALPDDTLVSNAVTATASCNTSVGYTVIHQDSAPGCTMSRVFTIIATDGCKNSSTTYLTNTWTANNTPPGISVPAGYNLGCNPTFIPDDTYISNNATVTASCGVTVTYTVTHQDSAPGCAMSRTFTISAVDSCGNKASLPTTYTWTANSTPLVLVGVPANANLGCNPASVPTAAQVKALISATNGCGSGAVSVTSADTTAGCLVTRIYTISALDTCGNTASASVTNTWTANSTPLVLVGVPANANLGCNPASVPTAAQLQALISATNGCGSGAVTVTSADTTAGCLVMRIYSISALDTCGNTASASVTNTWTANSTPLVLVGVPANANLGCNPVGVPTAAQLQALISATNGCGSGAVTVTSADTISGCLVARVYSISALDACGNTASASVTNTWTANNTPLVLVGVPANANLGCNPATVPTAAQLQALISATNGCGSGAVTVTSADTTAGCLVTRIYTISALDTCGNTASASVTNTWTANNTPLVLVGVPANANLGCNPASVPTAAQLKALISATNRCGSGAVTVTSADTTAGCLATRIYTIGALDACGNTASASVTNTWTANNTPLVLVGVPANANLGCNPASVPTSAQLKALISATNGCGSGAVTVTSADTTAGCLVTRVYSISALDACGNTASASVTNTWTANNTPLVLVGVPANANLGCNPASVPTAAQVKALISATNGCGAGAVTVTCADTTNGCVITRVYTISAIDACSNVATAYATNVWTASTVAPTIMNVPASANLGCNPTVSTAAQIAGIVSASGGCGPAAITVTSADSSSGCAWTRIYTITASNICGNVATAHTTNTWTANSGALTLSHVPASANLGCNPTSVPTAAQVAASITATNGCGAGTVTVTSADSTNGCTITRIYTINAVDGCLNRATASTTNTWKVDTTAPTISGVPTGTTLGCNPPTLPSITSVSNCVHVADGCNGTPAYTVTQTNTTNGCVVTSTFTITATDACNNHASATTTYTWTTDSGPAVTCPPNVTIATNFSPVYCTFTPSDWNSSCNGPNTTPTWWTNWDYQNHAYNCAASWTNWWTGWTGNNPGTNCWNFCQTPCTDNNNHNFWSGGSCDANSAPSWCASWNRGNPNNNWWVPCNGYNPGSVLTNCFPSVYSNSCVQIGWSNGFCLKLTSCNSIRTCLGFSGNAATLSCSATNPTTCNAGSFGAQVCALQLNCDFGDKCGTNIFGGKCGDLVLCDPTSPCHGQKVRDILKTANCCLGGGSVPSGCTPAYLCTLVSNINQCFEGCQVSTWCQTHLVPVFIPPPSQTGTATVTSSGCSASPVLTYSDSVASGTCSGGYVITRTWSAVDACGMSNYCTQLITITTSPGPSISGTIVNDCGGAGCGNNNNNWNNWNWGNWNNTPDFSGDAGIAGVLVTLKSPSGAVIATTHTDTNGTYTFANPGAGTYTVVVTPPSGYALTYPTTGTSNQTAVTVTACQAVTGLQFAYIGSQTGVSIIKTGPTNACSGQTITYNFAVTNTGNNCVALSVIDPLLGGQIFSQSSVAPGQGFTFSQNYAVCTANVGSLTNTAWAVANPASGPNVTNYSWSTVAAINTKCTNETVCGSFNSQNPGGGYVWCNAHLSANPGKPCIVYCTNASITLTCNDGKTYTFPVPDCQINFSSSCTTGSSSFDGKKWTTTLPCNGDDEIFLSGCGIPWQADFANCHNVCWKGKFCSSTTGVNCNWQWSAACYNSNLSNCGAVSVKPCHNVPCGFPSGDHAGTPENCKPSVWGGACGGGGSNYTGSWSGTGSFSCNQ